MTKIENEDSDKAETPECAAGGLLELVVLSVKENAARCRLLGSEGLITLRTGRLWELVPGEIALVRPRKQWSYAGHPYLSGEIESWTRGTPTPPDSSGWTSRRARSPCSRKTRGTT